VGEVRVRGDEVMVEIDALNLIRERQAEAQGIPIEKVSNPPHDIRLYHLRRDRTRRFGEIGKYVARSDIAAIKKQLGTITPDHFEALQDLIKRRLTEFSGTSADIGRENAESSSKTYLQELERHGILISKVGQS
jgi:hypothetical protein